MKLYSEMDKLGDAVLYHDTYFIIYASNGENDPPLGNFLGEFTDELNGDTIKTFVSGMIKFTILSIFHLKFLSSYKYFFSEFN